MLKVILYPLSLIYGVVVFFRNRFYDLGILKSYDFDIPVISVGNITVGGTGKTTHIEYLAALLKEQYEVAVLSRGYKRKSKGFKWVEAETTVDESGDEPLQIKRKFPEITVAVCENRLTGIRRLFSGENPKIPDVVLLDDAFQHRRINPGINILLIDYNRPVWKDSLLPAGRLREGFVQVRRAGIIIFSKCHETEVTPIQQRLIGKEIDLKPYQQLYFTTYQYDKIRHMFSGNELAEDFYVSDGYSVLVVTGIANPLLVYEYIKQYASDLRYLSFPDHHNFSDKDIELIMNSFEEIKQDRKIILTTEKDAVRLMDMPGLPDTLKEVLCYLPVRVKFVNDKEKFFDKKILNYVGENKSNRKLYKKQV
jgi:tetraacyldisaccharide 4'-kinase